MTEHTRPPWLEDTPEVPQDVGPRPQTPEGMLKHPSLGEREGYKLKAWTVFALCEPGTDIVRYIGSTTIKPERMLQAYYASQRYESLLHTRPLFVWFDDLAINGLEPDIKILTTTAVDRKTMVTKYIQQYRSIETPGHELLNLADDHCEEDAYDAWVRSRTPKPMPHTASS